MSAIAPRNSSPAIVVEKKDAFNNQIRRAVDSFSQPSGNSLIALNVSTTGIVLEILVLAAAAVAIVIVAYLVFTPLFKGIFETALDTINTLTDITAETLGTVTEVLGGVIEDASDAIKTVTDTVSETIGTLSNTISGTLDSIAGPATGSSEGGSLTRIADTVITTVQDITEIIVSQDPRSETDSRPKGIIPRLVETVDGIIDTTEELLVGDNGIMNTIKGFIDDFRGVINTASQEFQEVLKALKSGADTVINGVQDGIRYLVDPFVNETYGIPAIGNKMLTTIETLTGGITSVGGNIQTAINSISSAINNLG
jgi:phage-related protein